ncbi:hypothetical protein LTR53_010912 [Teratosphaeriaceae sp. CCFEE 6253]|nr:hypothetical protein LTR53_010912 [Teratosphaeriaceae sp. CCFEE 6253]
MRHVRDLEDGINLLQDKQSLLHTNNELLKLQLDNLKVENQVLHATIRTAPTFVDSPIPIMRSRFFGRSAFDSSSVRPIDVVAPASSPESESASTASLHDARVPIPRRAHKKSKTGCKTCRQRKVKVSGQPYEIKTNYLVTDALTASQCDERRPLCLNCERHFTNMKTCDFDEQAPVLQAPTSPLRAGRRPSVVRTTAARPKRSLIPKELAGPEPAMIALTDGLTIHAAWQVLQNHPQYLLDRVDVTRFCEGLRRLAAFDGKALVFERARVLTLINEASEEAPGG